MISATGFATSHTSTWKILAPTTDLFVKRLNSNMLKRDFPPLRSITAPARRAFVNEIGFELFRCMAQREFASSLKPIDFEKATDSARVLVARMQRSSEVIGNPNDEELKEASTQARRLEVFFKSASRGNPIYVSPVFAGCGMVDSCVGDVYYSDTLYEIKAGDRLFRSSDVRQILTYAALNKAARSRTILHVGLFNPRSGNSWSASLDEVCLEVSGRTADELLSEIIRIVSSGDTSR